MPQGQRTPTAFAFLASLLCCTSFALMHYSAQAQGHDRESDREKEHHQSNPQPTPQQYHQPETHPSVEPRQNYSAPERESIERKRAEKDSRGTFYYVVPTPPAPQLLIANPASVNCTQVHGGNLTIATDANGNQYGICWLDSNTAIEEWCLYRSDQSGGQIPCENLAN